MLLLDSEKLCLLRVSSGLHIFMDQGKSCKKGKYEDITYCQIARKPLVHQGTLREGLKFCQRLQI